MEFALVAPVLFLTLFGIIQVGLVFGKQLDLKSATRDGARIGAVSLNAADPISIIEDKVHTQLALSPDQNLSVSVSPPPPWNHGDRLTVSTRVSHAYSIMGVSEWSGDLRAESEIRVE